MARVIDLHTHSSVSDGTETPEELVGAAVDAGLDVVALTDHDTTAGWEEARRAAVGTDLVIIPGMELSTRHHGSSVHLLAYLFDPTDATLMDETDRIRTSRMTRAERIVERLARDYPLTWADVLEHTVEGATVGRPHIADALVTLGHAPDRSAAFADILHPRYGYVVSHHAPTPEEAIRMVRAAGGVPVLAHPATRGRDTIDDATMTRLVRAGLAGLEIEHRENTDAGKRRLRELAARHDLIVTGSSDYHGDGKPNRLAENTTAPEALDRILAEGRGSQPINV